MNRKYREDTVGGNVTTPPAGRNPRWRSRRVRLALLTVAGAGIAAYLEGRTRRRTRAEESALQLVGGPGSTRTEAMAARHGEDAVDMNVAAPPLRRNPSSRSYRVRVAIIAALGAVRVALVRAHGLIVHSWCCLCLITAAVSFLLVALVAEEVYACVHYLWRVWKHSHSTGVIWRTLWGQASEMAERAALSEEG